ncbi:MAG: hypothetical protein IIB87_07270, partial [Chloroflexi bacterium]|nr:hypothetical protein [Chloroflexota bacterium]
NQAQLELTGRGQDIVQREQDINAQIQANQQALEDAQSQRDYAISISDQAARQDAENRIRASEGAAIQLEAQAAQLDAAQFEQTGQLGAATTLGTIGRDLGNIELQRDQMLSRMLANPRDAVQLQIALGGGVDFFEQLLGGQTPGGQSIGNIGTTPLLGDLFLQTLQDINQRPELGYFEEAAGFARTLGETEAPATLSPEELYQQYLASLPPMSALPEAPAPFVPTPVDVAPVAPFVPPELEEITTEVPLTFIEQEAETMRQEATAAAEAFVANYAPTATSGSLFDFLAQVNERGPLPYTGPPTAPVPSAAGGADLVVDEPTTAYGDITGEPKFTLGERTPEFPEGIPERVEITPMDEVEEFRHGGRVRTRARRSPRSRRGRDRRDTRQRDKDSPRGPRRSPCVRSPDRPAHEASASCAPE